jgi:hypothetical protein
MTGLKLKNTVGVRLMAQALLARVLAPGVGRGLRQQYTLTLSARLPVLRA